MVFLNSIEESIIYTINKINGLHSFGLIDEDIHKKIHIKFKKDIKFTIKKLENLVDSGDIEFYRGFYLPKNYKTTYNKLENKCIKFLNKNFLLLKKINLVPIKRAIISLDEYGLNNLLVKLQYDKYILKIKKDCYINKYLFENYLNFLKNDNIITINTLKNKTGLKHESTVLLVEYFDRMGYTRRIDPNGTREFINIVNL